jgi:hypothetical protein
MYRQLPNPSLQHVTGTTSSPPLQHVTGTTSKPSTRIHWKAPMVMSVSMILGVVFVFGHHFFYHSLHHTPTNEAVFQQEVNTGIGTAFAFLIRMFLVISVGTAYWQLFWLQVKRKPTSLESLDTLISILENAFKFFNVRTLASFPVLAIVAIVLWYEHSIKVALHYISD